MPTSKRTPGSLKAEIAVLSKPVGTWLDARQRALVIEMAEGQRLTIALTAEQFEQKRQAGFRVYDSERRK